MVDSIKKKEEMNMEELSRVNLKKQSKKLYPRIISWSLVVIWMGIIFWFSSQPSDESARLSFSIMRLGGQVLHNWQLVGLVGFIFIFTFFLIWLSRRSTPAWVKSIFFILFLACCIAVVYILYYIVRPRIGQIGLQGMNRSVLHIFLRKYAHFFIYLLLGIVVKNALSVSGMKGFKSVLIALVICSIYAVTDEIHQAFVPGRRALLSDVFIDSAGSLAGIVFYSIIDWISGYRSVWQAYWNIGKTE